MHTVTLAGHAMATRFEIVLCGDHPVRLRAAGEAALKEIERLEAQLSPYRPESEIAQVNACAAREPVRVSPGVFTLLQHARRLHQESGGAFDITIGTLVGCWGFRDGRGTVPDPEALARAREETGMHRMHLNPADSTVQFERQGMMLDLGAIGKGYAVDQAADILREAGVTRALIHGGTSTVYALGRPPDAESWNVAIASPALDTGPVCLPAGPEALPCIAAAQETGFTIPRNRSRRPGTCATVPLHDEAMSVSAVWGKSFSSGGKTFGHVLDPRSGQPAGRAVLGAVILPSATDTDALSTALLVLGPGGHARLSGQRPNLKTLLLFESEAGIRSEAMGIPAYPT